MDIINEWDVMRRKHPFFGENLSEERIDGIWEKASATYVDGGMGTIPEMVTQSLIDRGMLEKNHSVLDVGCGPGVYGMRFSNLVKDVTCLDKSFGMLSKVHENSNEKHILNIITIYADWNKFQSIKKYDLVFSSLCPPLNCPEGILSLESYSSGTCAYVSSMNDDTNTIHMKIWKKLGREYTYNGYDTKYPYRYLKSIGRDPEIVVIESNDPFTKNVDDIVNLEKRRFSAYMDEKDIPLDMIIDEVESRSENGVLNFDGKKKIGLLTWNVA
jgi:SAM-dependent methyltransferase